MADLGTLQAHDRHGWRKCSERQEPKSSMSRYAKTSLSLQSPNQPPHTPNHSDVIPPHTPIPARLNTNQLKIKPDFVVESFVFSPAIDSGIEACWQAEKHHNDIYGKNSNSLVAISCKNTGLGKHLLKMDCVKFLFKSTDSFCMNLIHIMFNMNKFVLSVLKLHAFNKVIAIVIKLRYKLH